jgi:mono/diheme cytochrome c family protein
MSLHEGLHTRGLRTLGLVAVAGSLVLAAAGCGESTNPTANANLIVGKQQFVAKCGACHTLARANTKGTVGPDLDDAFADAVSEADGRHAIRGVVEAQIRYPSSRGVMPKDLVKGATVTDVASYVAYAAARPGSDAGLLAQATMPQGPGVATTPQLAEGKSIFTGTGGCSSCHTLADAGSTGTIGPNLNERLRSDCESPASKPLRGATLKQCIQTAITDPYKYIPSGYSAGIMPSTFGHTLSSKQIEAIVAYLARATEPNAKKS